MAEVAIVSPVLRAQSSIRRVDQRAGVAPPSATDEATWLVWRECDGESRRLGLTINAETNVVECIEATGWSCSSSVCPHGSLRVGDCIVAVNSKPLAAGERAVDAIPSGIDVIQDSTNAVFVHFDVIRPTDEASAPAAAADLAGSGQAAAAGLAAPTGMPAKKPRSFSRGLSSFAGSIRRNSSFGELASIGGMGGMSPPSRRPPRSSSFGGGLASLGTGAGGFGFGDGGHSPLPARKESGGHAGGGGADGSLAAEGEATADDAPTAATSEADRLVTLFIAVPCEEALACEFDDSLRVACIPSMSSRLLGGSLCERSSAVPSVSSTTTSEYDGSLRGGSLYGSDIGEAGEHAGEDNDDGDGSTTVDGSTSCSGEGESSPDTSCSGADGDGSADAEASADWAAARAKWVKGEGERLGCIGGAEVPEEEEEIGGEYQSGASGGETEGEAEGEGEEDSLHGGGAFSSEDGDSLHGGAAFLPRSRQRAQLQTGDQVLSVDGTCLKQGESVQALLERLHCERRARRGGLSQPHHRAFLLMVRRERTERDMLRLLPHGGRHHNGGKRQGKLRNLKYRAWREMDMRRTSLCRGEKGACARAQELANDVLAFQMGTISIRHASKI